MVRNRSRSPPPPCRAALEVLSLEVLSLEVLSLLLSLEVLSLEVLSQRLLLLILSSHAGASLLEDLWRRDVQEAVQ